MLSSDRRLLLYAATPTGAAGVIAVVVASVVAGGKGTVGAVVGAGLVIFLMGMGLFVLQTTAKKYPQLFQMMGLLLYAAQVLLMVVFLAVFKDTTLFNPRAFAFTLLASTLVWITAQALGYKKAKIMYIDEAAAASRKSETAGSPT